MKITITQPELVRVAVLFQSTEKTRYYLNGVYFCKAKRGGVYIISTDGHRMSIGYDAKGKIDKPAIIRFPADFLKHLTPKSGALTLKIEKDGMAEIKTEHAGSVAACRATVIDGTYPEWRRVVPTDEPLDSCHGSFNPKYLADYKAVLTALGIKESRAMKIVGTDDVSPHRVHIGGVDNWFGVLMPMRFVARTDIPVWYDAPPEERRS